MFTRGLFGRTENTVPADCCERKILFWQDVNNDSVRWLASRQPASQPAELRPQFHRKIVLCPTCRLIDMSCLLIHKQKQQPSPPLLISLAYQLGVCQEMQLLILVLVVVNVIKCLSISDTLKHRVSFILSLHQAVIRERQSIDMCRSHFRCM